MSKLYTFKDNVPEVYTKILSVGLDLLEKDDFSSIEIEIPIYVLADRFNCGGREQVRKKVKELFYFLDSVVTLESGEEFAAVVHIQYVIERDSVRIMYNEHLINKLIELTR